MPLSPRHVLRASAAAAALALLCSGTASAAPVGSGSLDWTMANVYDTATPAPNDRTWLGFVTSPSPFLGNGTVSASDGATGETVTPASPRGRDVLDTFSFPVQNGTYDAASGRGTIQLRGTVTFDTTGSQGGNFKITVTDPLVVLNGSQALTLPPAIDPPAPQPPAIQPPPAQGQVFATGTDVGGQPYDTSAPILNLDLGAATVTDAADGTRTIAGIVPAGAGANGEPFPFSTNDGPRRDPDLYGSLTVRLSPAPATVPAATGPAPAATSSTAAPQAAAAPVVAASRAVAVGLSGLQVRYGSRPAARVALSCPATQALCATSLRLTHGGRRIGSRQVLVAGGATRTVTLSVSKSAARRIERSAVRRVRLTVTTRVGASSTTVSRAVTARR